MKKQRRENEICLARRLRDGESGLFDQFADSIGSRLLQYGLMICRRRDDAEDIVQDTLMEVFRALSRATRAGEGSRMVLPHCPQRLSDAAAEGIA